LAPSRHVVSTDFQPNEVDVWLRAAGVDEPTARMILTLLTADEDPAGLQVRRDGERLLMTHQTVIMVARRG
jgi:hypothetical protein